MKEYQVGVSTMAVGMRSWAVGGPACRRRFWRQSVLGAMCRVRKAMRGERLWRTTQPRGHQRLSGSLGDPGQTWRTARHAD